MFKKRNNVKKPDAIQILIDSAPQQMTVEERVAMTVSCKDTDELPRVRNAGKVVVQKGQRLQIMHNGLKVLAGGYYGTLIESIVRQLRGHHEPQEEKVFHYLLKRIKGRKPSMIELGSHWSFYSMWFKSETGGTAICCEPDPHNIQIGRQNMALNGYREGDGLFFHQTAAGTRDGEVIRFVEDSNPNNVTATQVRTVDSLCREHGIKKLDILHMDVQGAELGALHGAEDMLRQGKLRFLVISTHHYVFSHDPLTHQKCMQFILDHGGHIVATHDILESFSGDGLIVASFDKADKDFTVPVSINTGSALFRAYTEDVKTLIDAYDKT